METVRDAATVILVRDRPDLHVFVLRRNHTLVFAPGATSPRVEIWRTALAAWRARPLLGQGPDALGMVFSHYQTPEYWRHEWGGAEEPGLATCTVAVLQGRRRHRKAALC